MDWNINDTIAYYRSLGAPTDQNALISLLREIQHECGGYIPESMLATVSQGCSVKESLLLALIRRIPSLKLGSNHILEICAGPNCGRCAALAAAAEKLQKDRIFTLKFVPCMRLCGKGPNIRWDGELYHRADEALLRQLTQPD